MNAASTDPSQTITVAAIHVPMPRMDNPSVRSSVTISDYEGRNQRDAAEHRAGAQTEHAEEERLKQGEDDREDRDGDEEPRHVEAHPVQHAAATISPTAFETNAMAIGREAGSRALPGEDDRVCRSLDGPVVHGLDVRPSGSSTNAA